MTSSAMKSSTPSLLLLISLVAVVLSQEGGQECRQTSKGVEYNGRKATTKSGRTCQRWDAQSPHPHDKNDVSKYPNAVYNEENYCRNPDGRCGGPWCYTTDPDVISEDCGIPRCSGSRLPNVVFIVADDLGHNDLGYMDPEIISPNLDKMAMEGVRLTNNYVMNACTPTRHALMTGRYPFKTQMAHIVLTFRQQHCSPTDIKFMPQYFKDLGYNTYMAGKWHLGFCQEKCLPNNRGFDNFYGFYQGEEDYFTKQVGIPPYRAYDFRDGNRADLSVNGTFNTYLLNDWLEEHFSTYDSEDPFFLYLTWPNPHTPLVVPEKYSSLYPNLNDDLAAYRGLITAMDEGVGNFTNLLKRRGLYDNTLFLFTSDNGGEHGGHANNLPYRGSKGSMWEGGLRALGFVNGPMINRTRYEHNGLFHVSDWIPTIMGLLGQKDFDADSYHLDGVDQSEMLMYGAPSKRDDIVFNIDMAPMPMFGQSAVRKGDWKFIWGCYGVSDGYGPDVSLFYEDEELRLGAGLPPYSGHSPTERAAYDFSPSNMKDMTQICKHYGWTPENTDCDTTMMYLFNLRDDPYEYRNLARDPQYAYKVTEMKQFILSKLPEYRQAPDANLQDSLLADPYRYGGIWTTGWCEHMDILNDEDYRVL